MKAILRKNKTDEDMIDIITIRPAGVYPEKEILWCIIHGDFLYGEGGALEEIFKANGEVNVEIDVKL